MAESDCFRHGEEPRIAAMALFESGFGHKATAKRLGLSKSTVRKWHDKYKAVGGGGLLTMGTKHTKYSWETKVAAAKAAVEDGEVKADVMARFGIVSMTSLELWCSKYRSGGADALKPKQKGRPKAPLEGGLRAMTREQELEERVRMLEAENAYLKKLSALRVGKRHRTGRNPR